MRQSRNRDMGVQWASWMTAAYLFSGGFVTNARFWPGTAVAPSPIGEGDDA